jgi:hypothetical protein
VAHAGRKDKVTPGSTLPIWCCNNTKVNNTVVENFFLDAKFAHLRGPHLDVFNSMNKFLVAVSSDLRNSHRRLRQLRQNAYSNSDNASTTDNNDYVKCGSSPKSKIRALTTSTSLIALDLAYDMESQESGILLQENTTEKYEHSIQEIQMVS